NALHMPRRGFSESESWRHLQRRGANSSLHPRKSCEIFARPRMALVPMGRPFADFGWRIYNPSLSAVTRGLPMSEASISEQRTSESQVRAVPDSVPGIRHAPLAEQYAAGKALREKCPRRSH